MPTYYIPLVVMFIVIFIIMRRRKIVIAEKVIKRKKSEETTEMVELAKRFIGKECIVYSFDSGRQFDGVIKEVSDGALLIEKNGQTEAINLDFVIRIREYPKNKKGKKKSVVVD